MTTQSPLASATPTRRERMVTPLTTLAVLGALTVALRLRDPHQHASWGLCPSAALGFACPGCGGLRAVNDLTRGDVLAAASSNLAFVVLLPFLVAGLAVWVVDRWRGTRTRPSPAVTRVATTVVIVLVVLFSVLRNLPVGSWLAP